MSIRLIISGAAALSLSVLTTAALAQGTMAPRGKEAEPVIPQGVTHGSSGIAKSTSQGPATLRPTDPNAPVGTGSNTISGSTAPGAPTLRMDRDPNAPVTTGGSGISKSTSGGMSSSGAASGSGMSSGGMSSSGATGAAAMTMGGDQIRNAQQALIADGAKIKADGKMGPRTKAALRAYQSKHGLARTGKLDAETSRSLGI